MSSFKIAAKKNHSIYLVGIFLSLLTGANSANANSEYYKQLLDTEDGTYFIEWTEFGGGLITPLYQELEDKGSKSGYVSAVSVNLLFEPKTKQVRNGKIVKSVEGLVYFHCEQDRSQALSYSFYANKRSNKKPSNNNAMGKDYIDTLAIPLKWEENSENYSLIRQKLLPLCSR
ncbi:MAG: hypothetical protein WCO61_01220 [Alphaproteobacteria bacterium]